MYVRSYLEKHFDYSMLQVRTVTDIHGNKHTGYFWAERMGPNEKVWRSTANGEKTVFLKTKKPVYLATVKRKFKSDTDIWAHLRKPNEPSKPFRYYYLMSAPVEVPGITRQQVEAAAGKKPQAPLEVPEGNIQAVKDLLGFQE